MAKVKYDQMLILKSTLVPTYFDTIFHLVFSQKKFEMNPFTLNSSFIVPENLLSNHYIRNPLPTALLSLFCYLSKVIDLINLSIQDKPTIEFLKLEKTKLTKIMYEMYDIQGYDAC